MFFINLQNGHSPSHEICSLLDKFIFIDIKFIFPKIAKEEFLSVFPLLIESSSVKVFLLLNILELLTLFSSLFSSFLKMLKLFFLGSRILYFFVSKLLLILSFINVLFISCFLGS